MKKDIPDNKVSGVTVAIANKEENGETLWYAYLLNNNGFPIDNVLITSKGYGKREGEQVKTSVTRQMFEKIEAETAAMIEPIDPALFALNNEYWVSYYIGKEIFDKRFVFVPETVKQENMSAIKLLDGMQGVLHD